MPARKKPQIPKIGVILRDLKRTAEKNVRVGLSALAKEGLDETRTGIEDQTLPDFAKYPLSSRWLGRKRALGLDERTLIATGFFLSEIRISTNNRNSWRIGFRRGTLAHDENGRVLAITLDQVGKIHEYGSASAGIPARRTWRVVQQSVEARASKVANGIAVNTVQEVQGRIR